jgi:hypothetical protein
MMAAQKRAPPNGNRIVYVSYNNIYKIELNIIFYLII